MVRRFTKNFCFNDTATPEIYTLSLHDALPIFDDDRVQWRRRAVPGQLEPQRRQDRDRKSTRLNSSHITISYAVFCLKKKTPQRFRQKVRREERRQANQLSLM